LGRADGGGALEDNMASVAAVSFPLDGSLLASASHDTKARI
jgi:hypothetical protein